MVVRDWDIKDKGMWQREKRDVKFATKGHSQPGKIRRIHIATKDQKPVTITQQYFGFRILLIKIDWATKSTRQ